MLDRALQLSVLRQLAENYPGYTMPSVGDDPDELRLVRCIHYLREHGLVDAALQGTITGSWIFEGARITARGLDFLEDDGGLTAILGVVTVKLHGETIKSLLTAKIEASPLPPEQKGSLIEKIKELPSEALSHLSTKLIDLGLEKGQVAFDLISDFLKSKVG